MTTKSTAKRGPGRPAAKKPTPPTAITVATPKIRTKTKVKGNVEYELSRPNGAIFMMRNTSYNLYDEGSGEMRNVRYSSNEPSIFRDEQTLNPIKSPVVFQGGKLFVENSKPNLIDFLDNHPQNESNGGSTFRRVDTVKKVQVELSSEFLVVDAVGLLRSKPLDDLLAVAVSRNIDVDRPVEEVKHDLLVYAKRSPQEFIEAFDSPAVRAKATVKQADSYQIIKVSPDAIKWFDTNKMIISIPAGKDPVDTFVRYLLTETGSAVLSELETQLSK